jgi:hypothetical protein
MDIILTPSEIRWIKNKYPNIKIDNKKISIKGQIYFNRSYNEITINDSYEIEIILKTKENSILPQVKEVGGKIREIANNLNKPLIDLHVNNNDNTLCLCIYKKEKEYFLDDFDIKIFFEQLLEPYLYWISYFNKYKRKPWGEYAHSNLGYLEMYAEEEIDIDNLKKFFLNEELVKIKKMKGHHGCLCGSNEKIKKCHKLLYKAIYKLKKEL